MLKSKERQEAIKLRRQGFSYNEILKKVSVAKSTLSLWLRNVGLSKDQKQRLTAKKLASAKLGWEARRRQRILITDKIKTQAKKEIGALTIRELWLIGISLYWAEGNKEKSKGVLVVLSNRDPYLIKLFLRWLLDICKIPQSEIYFEVYLHETSQSRIREVRRYWSKKLNIPTNNFQRVFWKKNKIFSKRKNISKGYFGLLRVVVRKSTNFNRKIAGWIEGICQNL